MPNDPTSTELEPSNPAASGMLLVAIAAIAMLWANSGASSAYFGLRDLAHWVVNDVLMTIFFFAVGLEIRGETHHGELRDVRRAALPIAAAVGGMLVPAGLYLAVAGAPETAGGWGVPMATDIAFALGVLALLGDRVPPALRVLLLALAVIDDLGAMMVIAAFYSDGTQGGLHPATVGVVIGLLVPVRASSRLLHALHPWVSYAIMPIFALTNAGVALGSVELDGPRVAVSLGIVFGLLVGKPLGVLAACWLATKLGAATLPNGIGFRELLVLGLSAGIGFTMSLFIAQLAFSDAMLLAAAKLAVLVASASAAVLALIAGALLLRKPARAG